MIYMTPQSRDMTELPRHWGVICGPRRRHFVIPEGRIWCMDNDCFSIPWNFDAMSMALQKAQKARSTCKFVSAPDVVANAVATLWMFRQWAWRIQALNWPVAFVAQDGQEALPVPWNHFDALFIGGSTDWKLSPHADRLILEAKALGKWTHVGRVNSQKRIRHFQQIGVDSVDGTSICFAPDKHYARFDRQLLQPALFHLEEA